MEEHVRIDARFCGPPGTGHGGYVSGVVAAKIGADSGAGAEITLRRPVPLDRILRVERPEQGHVTIHDDDVLIAEATTAVLDLDIPEAPSLAQSEDAARRYFGLGWHPYPQCFACGDGRAAGSGLAILSGPVDGSNVVAAPWRPHQSLAGSDGTVGPEYLWAALDCPSAWAMLRGGDLSVLLGRITARVKKGLDVGTPCIVYAWPIATDGRKLHAGSAIVSEAGELWGASRATWITT